MAIPKGLRRGLQLPVIAAPMFIVSTPALVIAQCKAGIVGSFPALNARPAPVLEAWLDQITTELAAHDASHPDRPSAPFAVNLIVHRSNDRLETDLAACVKYKVPLVITSLGAREDVNEAVHAYGGLVMHDVINQTFARKAIEKGADGLILVAAGAGGHAGALSPFAIVEETRRWFTGPIALSGAISTGRGIRAARAIGADFAYIGSAFIATDEANAVDAYKTAVVSGEASDIILSDVMTGINGNYLRSSMIAMGIDPEQVASRPSRAMDFGDGGAIEAKAWRDIWGAGQGIGSIRAVVSAAALIERLSQEFRIADDILDLSRESTPAAA